MISTSPHVYSMQKTDKCQVKNSKDKIDIRRQIN